MFSFAFCDRTSKVPFVNNWQIKIAGYVITFGVAQSNHIKCVLLYNKMRFDKDIRRAMFLRSLFYDDVIFVIFPAKTNKFEIIKK
jgi:hypothetical protein